MSSKADASASLDFASSVDELSKKEEIVQRTPADMNYGTRNRASLNTQRSFVEQPQKDVEEQSDKDKKEKQKTVSVLALWRFSTLYERFLILIGIICSMGHGILQPLIAVVFGNIIDGFSSDNVVDAVRWPCITFVIIACAAGIAGWGQVSMFTYTGSKQVNRIRQLYLRAIIRQEMGWFDSSRSGELTTRIAGDVIVIQDGISDKVGSAFQFVTMFVAGFIIAFVKNWKMTLVILSVVPLIGAAGAFMGKVMSQASTEGQAAYAKAGSVAEEVLSSIRTVTSFGGQTKEQERYAVELLEALRVNSRGGHIKGFGIGALFFVMFSAYGLAFWYGSTLIYNGEVTVGIITTCFFAVIMGAMGLGQAAPSFTALAAAQGAAYAIFETIDRIPLIDTLSEEGEKPSSLKGDITFEDIEFFYPKRPDIKILRKLNVSVQAGQTLALVGPSGCGKSTTVALLQRFYDPLAGRVTLDGKDIRKLNVRWLRAQIGVVSQEPVLFGRTIGQNIILGHEGATQAEIEAAAKMANAHDFIMKLPHKYDTLVGERGASLSGGQKQRIAIARALLRDPKILLLDEATSALDTKSEKVVQDALDKASKGRTTIVIAHRLSTIRNADKIVVIDKGQVVEEGTHTSLMELNGQYANLVQIQQVRGAIKGTDSKKKKEEEEEEEEEEERDVDDVDQAFAQKPENVRALTSQSGKKSTDETPAIEDEELNVPTKGAVMRAYRVSAPEWFYLMMGVIGAAMNGASFPVYSIIFSHVLSDLLVKTGQDLLDAGKFWALMFLALAAGMALANYLQNAMLTVAGERLTNRLRKMLFAAVIRQDIAWFDESTHSTGALATKLSNDSARVQGALGGNLGTMTQTIATLVAGLVIAFTACWQLSLVVLGCVPLIAIAGAFQLKLLMGFNVQTRKAYEESGKVASEAVENIRTVVALGREATFMQAYADSLVIPNIAAIKQAWLGGIAFGFSQAMTFLIWAMAFYYGANLVDWGATTFQGLMLSLFAIIFGGMMIGQATQLAPDFNKAVIAAAQIFYLVDKQPSIDAFATTGLKPAKVEGKITFERVTFRYPTRPDVQVLRGMTFDLEPGKTMALVGASGCGKSTVIGLLERFYDPESGNIFIDGVPIKDLNIQWMRSQMGLVGQEPILFATSIYENIAYGKPGATKEDVEQAARHANIHDFITALPDGYNTYVGERGTQLSGGQKQRIAIARSLIRNPRILLLDEATSALDSESEKVVQEALDKARLGRTTIVIAHRLSTIQDADVIAVVDQGMIVEAGTHQQLLSLKKMYYNLVNNQAIKI